jgi:hypothetical protein
MLEAYVFIDLDAADDPQSTAKAIKKVPGVKFVRLLFGPIDALAQVKVDDISALTETVFQINSLAGVDHTDTRIVVD